MRKTPLGMVALLFAGLVFTHTATASACKVDQRFPGGISSVAYNSDLNANLGDWGSIFLDADDDACATTARSYLAAKLQSQNGVTDSWTQWLRGGDVYLLSGAALRLGARGLLTSQIHSDILVALGRYYDTLVGVNSGSGCGVSNGNGCMDEYSVAAAGYAWAGAYLTFTQATVQSPSGTHNAGDFQQLARSYVKESFSPAHTLCIHDLSNSCTACNTTDYNLETDANASTLQQRINSGQSEILSYEHGFENPNYGIGLLTSVATAVLGLNRGGYPYSASAFEKVMANGLFRTGQLHAPQGATACDGDWLSNCVTTSCAMSGQSCVGSCYPTAPPANGCSDGFGYTASMYPVQGLLQREFQLTSSPALILGSPSYQFDQFNGTCTDPGKNKFSTTGAFFNDGRYAAYYQLTKVWSDTAAQGLPRIAGVDPVQYVDVPSPGQTIPHSATTFSGWSFDGGGTLSGSSFAVTVDGLPTTLSGFAYGGWRNDVCSFYSLTNQLSNCPVGWSGTFTPPGSFTAGLHTLKITATSPTGSVSTFTRYFNY